MIRIKKLGGVVAMAISIPMMTFAGDVRLERALKLNDEGVKLIEAKDYKAAIKKFQEALETSPKCASAAKNVGKLMIMGQRFKEAKIVLARTLDAVPDDSGCMVQMIQACAFLGETQECIKWIEKLATVGDAPTVRSLPVLLLEQGSLKEAAVASEVSVEKDGADAVRWFNRGLVADAIPNDEIAEESYRKAIELNASYVEALVNLGNLLERRGRVEDMFKSYEKAYSVKACALTEYNLGRKLVQEKKEVSRGLDLLFAASQRDDEFAEAATKMLNVMINQLKKNNKGGVK